MSALRQAVEVDFKYKDKHKSQGLYLLTTGIPDQETVSIITGFTALLKVERGIIVVKETKVNYLDVISLSHKEDTNRTRLNKDISAVTLYDLSYQDCTSCNTNLNIFSEKENIIYSITRSRHWFEKGLYRKIEIPFIELIEDIVRTARYYIYSLGTDDDYYNSKKISTLRFAY